MYAGIIRREYTLRTYMNFEGTEDIQFISLTFFSLHFVSAYWARIKYVLLKLFFRPDRWLRNRKVISLIFSEKNLNSIGRIVLPMQFHLSLMWYSIEFNEYKENQYMRTKFVIQVKTKGFPFIKLIQSHKRQWTVCI